MAETEKYLNALAVIERMRDGGIISAAERNKAERYLAQKYCIKKGSIYRRNDLINSSFRAIYSVPKDKETNNGNGKKG